MKELESSVEGWSFIFDVADDILVQDRDEHFITQGDFEDIVIDKLKDLLMDRFIDDELWGPFIGAWQQRYKLPRTIRALMAHGDHDEHGGWWFLENGQPLQLVGDWVRQYDGRSTILVTCCCNVEVTHVATERSLLLISNGVIHGGFLDTLDSYSVVTPTGIQDCLTLEYDTQRLRAI